MTDETDVYICGICKKEFQDFVTFLQHKSSFGVFKCKLCDLSYHDKADIQQHITESHNNQKVDVVFTIPTKANIVSTKTEQTDNEPVKIGGSTSVYTCRLCSRYTLIEKIMLQHLQNVHKIHVSPGSVELAALMLCSKPLDSSSIPRLAGSPLVVKTVTAPVSTSKTTTVATGTQTRLSSSDIASVSKMDLEQKENMEWIELAEETATNNSNQQVEEVVEEAEKNENQSVKMTSILKLNVMPKESTDDKPKTECNVVDVQLCEVEQVEQIEQVVCVDGGHDYISNIEVKKDEVQLEVVEEEEKIDEVSALMELQEEVESEEPEMMLLPSPKKYVGRKSTSVGTSRTVVSQPAKRTLTQLKRPAMKSISRPTISSSPKAPEPEDDDTDDLDDEDDELEQDEMDEDDEDPQPGPDGMYHCRQCNRAFARERQFKAHMNVHVMYGEHYLESPGGGPRYEMKSTFPNRKRPKTDLIK